MFNFHIGSDYRLNRSLGDLYINRIRYWYHTCLYRDVIGRSKSCPMTDPMHRAGGNLALDKSDKSQRPTLMWLTISSRLRFCHWHTEHSYGLRSSWQPITCRSTLSFVVDMNRHFLQLMLFCKFISVSDTTMCDSMSALQQNVQC